LIDLEHFSALIRERIRVLTADRVKASRNATVVELDQTRVGRLSRMDAMQMQQMELAMSRRQQRELGGLENALNRIDSGEFGRCFECDEDINPRRLEIDPIATLCISCAERREK
jgi:DnaK suppressor protein